MKKIWCYGYLNLDVSAQPVTQWPELGHVAWVDKIGFQPGGVALNPALTIARLGGVPVGIIGCVGGDQPGQTILAALDKYRVDVSRLVVLKTHPTGVCIVCVHPDGERSFIMNVGANAALKEVTLASADFSSQDIFHLSGMMSLGVAQKMLPHLKSQGVTLSADTSVDSNGEWWSALEPLFPHLDIFMANALESHFLTGTKDPERSAQQFYEAGVQIAVIKLGAEGAYFHSLLWSGHIPAFEVAVTDTTGAGDSFGGALLYGLAQGWPLEQAGLFANAVGGLCTTVLGATAGIRSYAETVAFIRSQNRAGAWVWDSRIVG